MVSLNPYLTDCSHANNGMLAQYGSNAYNRDKPSTVYQIRNIYNFGSNLSDKKTYSRYTNCKSDQNACKGIGSHICYLSRSNHTQKGETHTVSRSTNCQ